MKTAFIAILVTGVIYAIKAFAEYDDERREMEESSLEIDNVLTDVLAGCMEAYCEDCGVLAQGTHPYHDKVASVAYNHSEIYDHMVHLRTWADNGL